MRRLTDVSFETVKLGYKARISGGEAVAVFRSLGYEVDRQEGAATLSSGMRSLPVAASPFSDHRELAKGTLRLLIREAGITVEEFAVLRRW